jgi:hypothetical protein
MAVVIRSATFDGRWSVILAAIGILFRCPIW